MDSEWRLAGYSPWVSNSQTQLSTHTHIREVPEVVNATSYLNSSKNSDLFTN